LVTDDYRTIDCFNEGVGFGAQEFLITPAFDGRIVDVALSGHGWSGCALSEYGEFECWDDELFHAPRRALPVDVETECWDAFREVAASVSETCLSMPVFEDRISCGNAWHETLRECAEGCFTHYETPCYSAQAASAENQAAAEANHVPLPKLEPFGGITYEKATDLEVDFQTKTICLMNDGETLECFGDGGPSSTTWEVQISPINDVVKGYISTELPGELEYRSDDFSSDFTGRIDGRFVFGHYDDHSSALSQTVTSEQCELTFTDTNARSSEESRLSFDSLLCASDDVPDEFKHVVLDDKRKFACMQTLDDQLLCWTDSAPGSELRNMPAEERVQGYSYSKWTDGHYMLLDSGRIKTYGLPTVLPARYRDHEVANYLQ